MHEHDLAAVDARGGGVARYLLPAVRVERAAVAHQDDRHGQAFFARRHDVGETLRQVDVLLPRDLEAEVEAYLGIERTQMTDYRKHAL